MANSYLLNPWWRVARIPGVAFSAMSPLNILKAFPALLAQQISLEFADIPKMQNRLGLQKGDSSGVIKWDPCWGYQRSSKCVVMLRNFIKQGHCLGWQYDPCSCQDILATVFGRRVPSASLQVHRYFRHFKGSDLLGTPFITITFITGSFIQD